MTHTQSLTTYYRSSLPDDDLFEITEFAERAVPYHIRTDDQTYRLREARYNRQDAFKALYDYANADTDTALADFAYLPDSFYGVYTASRDNDLGSTDLSIISNSSSRTVVNTYVTLFEAMMNASDSDWNKPMNAPRAGDIIGNRTQWKQPIVSVACDILSTLILGHPLPNTNHRSSLALTLVYLDTVSEGTDYLDPDVVEDLMHWMNLFIRDSKTILTVRRNTGLFEWLNEAGITHVVRKNNLGLDITEYDYSQRRLYDSLTDDHSELCYGMLTDIVFSTDNRALIHTEDDGLRVFSDRIQHYSDSELSVLAETLSSLED